MEASEYAAAYLHQAAIYATEVAIDKYAAAVEAAQHPAPPPRPVASAPVAPPPPPSNYGCGPALAYLQVYAAPGFVFECPGYALGHEAMTCINIAGVCPGEKLIAIADPCQAAYMNEASNSWVLQGLRQGPIDPYGAC